VEPTGIGTVTAIKFHLSGDINEEYATALLADPQTSGGLLIAVEENAAYEVQDLLQSVGLYANPVGKTKEKNAELIRVC
jgi:selenide,water dikinase